MLRDGFSSDIASTRQDLQRQEFQRQEIPRIRERGGFAPRRARPSMRRSDLRILVVDDEAVIGILIEDILLDLGCASVDVVGSVESALTILEAASPDFAFLDINLNGTRSYPVADALKSRDIPFVFLSAYATHGRDTVHAGEKILQKPFFPRDLELALDSAFPLAGSIVRAA